MSADEAERLYALILEGQRDAKRSLDELRSGLDELRGGLILMAKDRRRLEAQIDELIADVIQIRAKHRLSDAEVASLSTDLAKHVNETARLAGSKAGAHSSRLWSGIGILLATVLSTSVNRCQHFQPDIRPIPALIR